MKRKLLGITVLSAVALFMYNEFNAGNAQASGEKSTAQLGDMQLQIHSVETHAKLVDGTGFIIEKPNSDNGELIVIEATVTNTGLAQLELDSQLVYNLVTSDGAVYEPTAITFDNFFGVEEINPSLSLTGQLAFEVPVGLSEYELQINLNDVQGTVPIP